MPDEGHKLTIQQPYQVSLELTHRLFIFYQHTLVTLSQIKSEQNPANSSRVERYRMEREMKSRTATLCLYETFILQASK
jgi:hypothetical protein